MNFRSFAREIEEEHPAVRVDLGPTRHFPPERFHDTLNELLRKNNSSKLAVGAATAGLSFEGRPIRLLTIGKGKTGVLLWSQMHGDESTATMAILDILRYLTARADTPAVGTILSSLTLHFLPMLNPDGAARCQRRTAQQIDMNRDALALQTPEARLLKSLQKSLKPAFGFNLHDQELSTVGQSRELTALALLAPAYDHEKSENDVRRAARQLGAFFAEAVRDYIPGRLARYDDSFEPRAFGDNMQKWGTSTLLVESGHAAGDVQKEFIRRITFTGILAGLYALASGEQSSSGDSPAYADLPFNSKRAYDLIVRNVRIGHAEGRTTSADLGISSQVDTHSELPARLVDMGDLSTFTGFDEIDANGEILPADALTLGQPFSWKTSGF